MFEPLNNSFHSRTKCHAILSFEDARSSFFVIPIGTMYVDEQYHKDSKESTQILSDLQKGSYRAIDNSSMTSFGRVTLSTVDFTFVCRSQGLHQELLENILPVRGVLYSACVLSGAPTQERG